LSTYSTKYSSLPAVTAAVAVILSLESTDYNCSCRWSRAIEPVATSAIAVAPVKAVEPAEE
jgi:hypothetical protein